MSIALTLLVALVGILVTVLITVTMPRVLGQLVPTSALAELRLRMQADIDKAEAEAKAMKTANEGLLRANDQLASTNRELVQGAVLANAVMNGLRGIQGSVS